VCVLISECRWGGMVQRQVLSVVLAVAVTRQTLPSAAVWHYCTSLRHRYTVPAGQLNVTFTFYQHDFSHMSKRCHYTLACYFAFIKCCL